VITPRVNCVRTSDADNERLISSDTRRLDFWLLWAAGLSASVGLYLSILGFRAGPDVLHTVAYLCMSTALATTMALVAATAPRKAGLPVAPICESLLNGSLNLRRTFCRLVVALTAGAVGAYAVFGYARLLTRWMGDAFPPTRHFLPSAGSIVCGAIIEEIAFRAVVFSLLALAMKLASAHLLPQTKATPIWIANVLQALIFGGAHLLVGMNILRGMPWCVRVTLAPQTWVGLVNGCIYWSYGIESAMACHATTDLLLSAIMRGSVPAL
jgi:CAAX prenyl protease-like protein